MANMEVKNFGLEKMVQFWDCEFETGKVTGSGDIKKGTVLARAIDGSFEAWDGTTGNPVAVYVDNDETIGSGIPCRALISGKVHKELILVAGAEATVAQLDALKAAGIIALPCNETNITDNQ